MERRLVLRTPHPHRSADQEGEQADRGQHEIHRVAARRRRERELQRLAGTRSEQANAAAAAAVSGATSVAVTPSARADQSTPSSTSCHREYIATFATPSATRNTTTVTANAERPQTSQRVSSGSS